MPMAAISSPDTAPAAILTPRGSLLSGFMPSLRPCSGFRFAAIGGFVLFFSAWPINDLGLGMLQSGQRRASVGTSTWQLVHFLGNPHDAIWSSLAVRWPARTRRGYAHLGE